jgi:hypothetical protein
MKKVTLLYVLFFCLCSYSQPGRQNWVPYIFFLNTEIGWYSSFQDSTIYKTIDGGRTWLPQNYPTRKFGQIMFTNDSVGFLAGWDKKLYKTVDQGESWNVLYDHGGWSHGTYFKNEKIGYSLIRWIYYDQYGHERIGSKITKTTDGGTAWDTIYKLPESYTTRMWVHNNNYDDVTIYGSKIWDPNYGGLIARSTNNINYLFQEEGSVWWVVFVDSLRGFAKRDSALGFPRHGIEKTTDGGRSWFHDTLECSWWPPMFFTDSLHGFVMNFSSILKTNNAGETWESLAIPGGSMFWYFIDSLNGFILSFPDYPNNLNWDTWQTKDGGYEWQQVGSFITNTEAVTVRTFSLSQNYPNPFNPGTTIKYSLGNISQVSIDVYDVLGNKIVSLVNEEKQPGEYEVQWNASGYSSGVYFYKLKANEFIQIRKMLLLK